MSFLVGTEKTKSIWGRLLLIVMFGSYILACINQQSLMPVLAGGMLFVAVALLYYIPVRFFFWMFTGSGEITVPFLLYLPFVFMTAVGFALAFMSSTPLPGN